MLFVSLALVKALYQIHFQELAKFQIGDFTYALVYLGWKWLLHVFFSTKILVMEWEEEKSLAVISLLHTGFHIKEFILLCVLCCITACVPHCFFLANFYNLENADDSK